MVVKKVENNSNKKGTSDKITKAEQEILHYLTVEFMTIKKIAIKRKTTVQAVYKITKRLQKKGFLNKNRQSTITTKKVKKNRPTIQPFKHYIRLHGQEFNIRILEKGKKYVGVLKSGNLLSVDGNTVRLYGGSLEVYSGRSFLSDDVFKATAKSFEYWNRFFVRLESELGVVLVKNRVANVRLVNAHYAEVGNELARECEVRGDRIRVYARDDGKLWFTIDDSFSLGEAETLHPVTGERDMGDVVRPFFNDLRDNRPPLLSDIMVFLDELVRANRDTAQGLSAVVRFLEGQLPKEGGGVGDGVVPDYFG